MEGPVPFIVPDTRVPVGHLANDAGSILSHGKWPGVDAFATQVIRYQESTQQCNITIHDVDGTMVATRPIERGEELFFRYGLSYWVYQAYGSIISRLSSLRYGIPHDTDLRFVFHSALWMPYIEARQPDMPQLVGKILDIVHMLEVPGPLDVLNECLTQVVAETEKLVRYPMSEDERRSWLDKIVYQAGHGTVSNDPSRQA